MNLPQSKIAFDPLLDALREVTSWLDANHLPRIISTTLTADELSEEQLPSHCTITKRPLRGPRVSVRGRRRTNDPPVMIARWPNDGLLESEAAELMFIINGAGDLRLSDYILHCRQGDIIYVPPRLPKFDGKRPTYEIITPESRCDILFVRHNLSSLALMSVNIVHSIGDTHSFGENGEAIWHQNDDIKYVFMALAHQLQHYPLHKSTFYLLGALVALLKEEVESGNVFDLKKYPSESPRTVHTGAIPQAIRYIENHIGRKLTIDQVARWVGLSRTIFITRFREKTGKSFKQFQTDLRLDKAKVLLTDTTLSIDQISTQVGLTPGQLRQLFHLKYGCSPRAFRKANKNVQ